MSQVPAPIVALNAEREKVKTSKIEILIVEARKNRFLATALLLHALENPIVRSELVKEKTFKKHVLTLDELFQSTDNERLLLRRLSRLPEPLRQFLIYKSLTEETPPVRGLRTVLMSSTVQKWLEQWAAKDPAWTSLIDLTTPSEAATSESAEPFYQVSPYGLTTLPLPTEFHFAFAVRHRVTGDSVMVYARTNWNRALLDFHVHRIPERFRTNGTDLFRKNVSNQEWIMAFVSTFWEKILRSLPIDPALLADIFFLTHSWGPAYILQRALGKMNPSDWPFQARTYRDTLIPAIEKRSSFFEQAIPELTQILRRFETSPWEDNLTIPRSEIQMEYPLFRVITSAIRATLPFTTYAQFLMWLDRTLSKERKPSWFPDFIRREVDEAPLISSTGIQPWGNEIARALLDGWIWFLSLNDEENPHLKVMQVQVRKNLDFFTFIQPSDIFELLKAPGTSTVSTPRIIIP